MSPLIVLLVLDVVGVVTLILGWRGWRVDDHPLCRKCRFDLGGLWPGRERCPECGAALKSERAIRIGHRKRRRAPLVIVGLVTAAVMVMTIVVAGSFLAGPRAFPYTPGWLLSYEARYSSDRRAGPVLTELAKRIDQGILPARVVAGLVNEGLDRQGDRKKAWLSAWGDLLWSARMAGSMDAEQGRRFVRQMVVLDVSTWRRARIHQAFPVYTQIKEIRGGFKGSPETIEIELAENDVDGVVAAQYHLPFSDLQVWPGAPAGQSLVDLMPCPAHAGPIAWSGRWVFSVLGPWDTKTGESWSENHAGTITVVGENEPILDVIHDDAMAQRLKEAMAVPNVVLGRGFAQSSAERDDELEITLHFSPLPVPVAWDVFLAWTDQTGRRVEMPFDQSLVFPAGATTTVRLRADSAAAPPSSGTRVEVILRSTLEGAERAMKREQVPTMERVWLGPDIVLEGVPVDRRADREPR